MEYENKFLSLKISNLPSLWIAIRYFKSSAISVFPRGGFDEFGKFNTQKWGKIFREYKDKFLSLRSRIYRAYESRNIFEFY